MFQLLAGYKFLLASTSPRRADLLASLGIPFSIMPAGFSERPPNHSEDPATYALRMAQAKAAQISPVKAEIVLTADTVVAVGFTILGKPKDKAAAFSMLQMLNGRSHKVYTAIQLLVCDRAPIARICETAVTFASWPDAILAAYANSEEPLDKAGAYAIQGAGAFLIKEISGSASNVIGLPMCTLVETLLGEGLIRPADPCGNLSR